MPERGAESATDAAADSTAVDIRPFDLTHVEAAAALWLDSWRSAALDTGEGTGVDDLVLRMRAELAADWEAYLAWEGERLVGFLALKPAERCLDQIFVSPDAKRQGRGSQLLAFAKRRMPEGLWLRCAADNHPARRFYETHGMTAGAPEPHPRLGHLTVVYRWP